MATKKKAKRTPAKKTTRQKKAKTKVKKDHVSDLKQFVAAESGNALVEFSSDDVIGHAKSIVPTGSLAIDTGTGVAGLPSGRLVEVYGQPQCGKTTFTDHVLAETQRLGGVGVVCDVEEKKDLRYASKIGVDVDKLMILQSETAGQFKTFESVIRGLESTLDYWIQNKVEQQLTLVWDSVAATPTATEMEDYTSKEPGVPARLLRRAMRRLTQKIAQANALVLVTNQQYEKIGGFSRTPGVRRATYGGNAISYHASMRLEMVRTGWLKLTDGTVIGIEGICKFFKNNLAPPGVNPNFAILYGVGFSNYWSLFHKLKEFGYIKSGGAWYTLSIQGQEPVKFQKGFIGFGHLLTTTPELHALVMEIYKALTVPKEIAG